jgi:phosphoribosyl-ATP pyrophosphohydrolase/phosphoribosyl-AMP cyclohydrolase
MKSNFDLNAVNWSKDNGLVPAVVQDVHSLRVLMLGYMNREALEQTLSTGKVTFFSRSKQRLWQKGESSGHILKLQSIKLDCDQDTLLVMAEPHGPTCHNGTVTCWGDDDTPNLTTLADLAATIKQRHTEPQPGSYTAKLFESGLVRIAQKVGEEGVETALAGATGAANLKDEAADLIYHLLVLLQASGTRFDDVLKVLQERSRKNAK